MPWLAIPLVASLAAAPPAQLTPLEFEQFCGPGHSTDPNTLRRTAFSQTPVDLVLSEVPRRNQMDRAPAGSSFTATEDVLKRAVPSSTRRLAELYADALMRPETVTPEIVAHVRRELETSQDALLVESTGLLITLKAPQPELEFANLLVVKAETLDPDVRRRVLMPPPGPPHPVPPPYVPERIRFGSVILAQRLIKKVEPMCPSGARCQEGVRFAVIVGRDGKVRRTLLIRGDPKLVPPAEAALKQWQYKPSLANGAPVEVVSEVDVAFHPPKD